jgi:hypothetical protein
MRLWHWNRQTNEVEPLPDTTSSFVNEFEEPRQVEVTVLGPYLISTVFLVIDHGFGSVPHLFETMVFRGHTEVEGRTRRYSTHEEAVKGHQEAVEQVKRIVLTDE